MSNDITTNKERARYELLDAIRGLSIISMVFYHFVWDLVYILHVDLPWYQTNASYIWQQSICWTFILLSGFCWPLGKKKWKRGIIVFASGLLVSIVTQIVVPEDRILFGILTMIGSAMLLLIPFEKILNRISPVKGFMISAFLFIITRNINRGYLGFEKWNFIKIPEFLYQGNVMTFLGFKDNQFYSTDYFSLFPWIFLYIVGIFLYRFVVEKEKETVLIKCNMPWINFIGKKSLIFYLLHQPIIYAVVLLAE